MKVLRGGQGAFCKIYFFIVFLCDIFHHNGSGLSLTRQLLPSPNSLQYKQSTIWRRPPLSGAKLTSSHGNFTLTLTKSIDVPTPSYVQILQEGALSVTSFSLLRKGAIMEFDLNGVKYPKTFGGEYLWPNELSTYTDTTGCKVMLIPDGFLTPGQNDGAIYAIRDPNNMNSEPVRITGYKPGWFYHRAIHMKLPDGTEGVLTARANKPLFTEGEGELVWLNIPKMVDLLATVDSNNGVNVPWEETVLVSGPDVMFEVVDLDYSDDSVEIVAAHFFGRKLSVHSLRGKKGAVPVELSGTSTIDTVGRPYGLCLASLTPSSRKEKSDEPPPEVGWDSCMCDTSCPSHILVTTHECSYDFPSAVNMAFSAIGGNFPSIKGQALTTVSGVCDGETKEIRSRLGRLFSPQSDNSVVDFKCFSELNIPGGSLFAYEIPGRSETAPSQYKSSSFSSSSPTRGLHHESNRDIFHNGSGKIESCDNSPSFLAQKSNSHFEVSQWARKTLFRGFKVRGWGGIFSPGAPGFPYVFQMPNRPHMPPIILLAGDCTGSAYIFTPSAPRGRKSASEATSVQPELDYVDTIDPLDSPLANLFTSSSNSSSSSSSSSSGSDKETIRIRRAGGRDLAGAVQQVAFAPNAFGGSSSGSCGEREQWEDGGSTVPSYELAFEIECGATVGSAAVAEVNDGSGDANLYIPSYELNKVHVFRLSGSSE